MLTAFPVESLSHTQLINLPLRALFYFSDAFPIDRWIAMRAEYAAGNRPALVVLQPEVAHQWSIRSLAENQTVNAINLPAVPLRARFDPSQPRPGGGVLPQHGSLVVSSEGAHILVRRVRQGGAFDNMWLSLATGQLIADEPDRASVYETWELVTEEPTPRVIVTVCPAG